MKSVDNNANIPCDKCKPLAFRRYRQELNELMDSAISDFATSSILKRLSKNGIASRLSLEDCFGNIIRTKRRNLS